MQPPPPPPPNVNGNNNNNNNNLPLGYANQIFVRTGGSPPVQTHYCFFNKFRANVLARRSSYNTHPNCSIEHAIAQSQLNNVLELMLWVIWFGHASIDLHLPGICWWTLSSNPLLTNFLPLNAWPLLYRPLVAHNLSIQQQVDSNQHLHHQQHIHQQHIHHHHNNNNPQLWRHFEGSSIVTIFWYWEMGLFTLT